MIAFYKPNTKNTGAAYSFRINFDEKTGELALWISAVKQFSWDPNTRNGSFSENGKVDGKNMLAKFNAMEAEGIVAALTTRCVNEPNNRISYIHQSNVGTTIFNLAYSESEFKGNKKQIFFLGLTKNETNKIVITLEAKDEAHKLANFLRTGLSMYYHKSIVNELNRQKEFRAKKSESIREASDEVDDIKVEDSPF